MTTPRSGTSVNMQGRSPAVNVINITRHPDGGIVNIEMKRQEGLNQEANSRPSATAALPSRGAVPVNIYRHPSYVTDQQSNVISLQSPRKASPNVSAQMHSVDGHVDWSDQYQRLMTVPQRMPVFQHIPRSGTSGDQQRILPVSNHGVRTVVEQQVLHNQVNDGVLSQPQHAHALPVSDVRLMTTNSIAASAAIPSVSVHMEGTNGGISYWPAQIGNDFSLSSAASGRVVVDPKSVNVAPQLISRLPGLQYDVIPPRSDGPSAAERKVAELTQQLENEMRLTTSQGSSLRQQPTDTFSQYRSPPPYYGPHITANLKMSAASNPTSNSLTVAAGGDSELASKKAGDVGVRETVPSLPSGLADVEQSQLSTRQSSDVDVLTECYGKPVQVFNPVDM